MIVVSDNWDTNVLIDHVGGFDGVNAPQERIGLQQASFGRKMIQTANPELGKENYMSSDDMAATLSVIWEGSLLRDESKQLFVELLSGQTVATKFKAAVPEGTPLADKTGELGDISNDVGHPRARIGAERVRADGRAAPADGERTRHRPGASRLRRAHRRLSESEGRSGGDPRLGRPSTPGPDRQ